MLSETLCHTAPMWRSAHCLAKQKEGTDETLDSDERDQRLPYVAAHHRCNIITCPAGITGVGSPPKCQVAGLGCSPYRLLKQPPPRRVMTPGCAALS